MRQSAARRLILDDTGGVVLGAELWQFDSRSVAAARHRRLSRWAEAMFYVAPRLAEILRRRTLQIELADARPKHVRARGGVILSTGGFIFNRAMVSRYAPKYLRNFPLGTCGCDGSGIRLGQSVGGDAARMDRITAWRFINPPLAWSQGMIVDAEGRRFCNEEVYGARLGYEICERHDGKAWLVMDSTIRREAIREAVFGNLWAFQRMPALMLMFAGAKRGSTIEALARKISAQEKSLAQSLTEYNLAAERGEDPRGKSAELLRTLSSPFYALNISADMRVFPCPALTLGGLRVDETTGAVRKPDGGSISGLFAAGRAALGIASNHYVSGLALADCIWSGRRAGGATASSVLAIRGRAEARA